MKKMSYISILIVSLLCGTLVFIITSLILEFDIALISSLLFSAITAGIIPIFILHDENKYKNVASYVKNDIGCEPLNIADVVIKTGTGVRNGKLALTRRDIFLFLRDKKPYITEKIEKSTEHFVVIKDKMEFLLFVSEQAFYPIITGDDKLIDNLKENGWEKSI